MNIDTTSLDKRNSVKNNYNLIAEQYGQDFGTYIEDLDVYEEFKKHLIKYSYFNKQDYEYIGLDFSKKC